MKILRAWVSPFPNSRGNPSGMSSISLRVPKEEDDKFPLKLEKYSDIAAAIKRGESHYRLSLIDDDSLVILKEAIDDYLLKKEQE